MKDETDSSSEEEDSESDEGYADAEYTNSSEDDADDEEEWFFVYEDIKCFTKYTKSWNPGKFLREHFIRDWRHPSV